MNKSAIALYVGAGLLAIVGVTEGVVGIDIPGVTLDVNWFQTLLGALGLAGIGGILHSK